MLLSTVLTIQTVPYNAIINAHENMRYLSIIGVFQTLMKLVIALIVVHVYTDKLILYGILTTFVSLIFHDYSSNLLPSELLRMYIQHPQISQ